MLVGPSGAGKSTLSVALSRRGFTLATDDVALLDPRTLHIFPIPSCVHLDRHSVLLLEADGVRLPNAGRQFSFVLLKIWTAANTAMQCRTADLHCGTASTACPAQASFTIRNGRTFAERDRPGTANRLGRS